MAVSTSEICVAYCEVLAAQEYVLAEAPASTEYVHPNPPLRKKKLSPYPLTGEGWEGGRPVQWLLGFDQLRRSEEHTSELQSRPHLVCRLLLEKKKKTIQTSSYITKDKAH